MSSHATVLVAMVTPLGLFDDETPLLAANRNVMANRKFRTSKMMPLSANIGFVLYECKANNTNKKTVNIQLPINQAPVKIPKCDSMLCSYDKVRQTYALLIDSCDIKNICRDPRPNPNAYLKKRHRPE